MAVGDRCWVLFAEKLRKQMYRQRVFEMQVPIETVHEQSGTDQTLADLKEKSFWNAVRDAKQYWDTLPRYGIEADYLTDDVGRVEYVVFRLDGRRRKHLQSVMDRSGNSP